MMRETELHAPVAAWLAGQGYRVSAEVHHCDMVATTVAGGADDDQPIILEFKTRMTLDLVAQGVRRQEITPSVYLVVPLQGSAGRLRNARNLLALLRRLELGLIVVRFLRSGTRVEVVLHPRESPRRGRPKRRAAILREIDGRYAEMNKGGQTSRDVHFSAYRQRAIRIAALLGEAAPDPLAPAELRRRGAPQECGRVLSRNVYGWFERERRGAYRLSPAGEAALARYAPLLEAATDAEDGPPLDAP
jgi:hypothetical protein